MICYSWVFVGVAGGGRGCKLKPVRNTEYNIVYGGNRTEVKPGYSINLWEGGVNTAELNAAHVCLPRKGLYNLPFRGLLNCVCRNKVHLWWICPIC